ncbi:DUF1080 domain-containing protein [Candidatus Poribacteria bacterium]|nr:DUF1080 domain-containing protein [Candidatus Poribacteria bacterium]
MRYTMAILVFSMMALYSYAGTFTDNFSDGNMDGWVLNIAGAGGDWKVENGELILQSRGFSAKGFKIGENDWQDYTIQVNIKITKHIVTAIWEQAGIGFRLLTDNNDILISGYYLALGTPGADKKELRTYFYDFVNSQSFNLRSVPFEWKLDKWYVLKAVIEGNSFKHYVDDKLMMEYTDSNSANGTIGLSVTGSTEAHFDNFSMTGHDIQGNSESVYAQDKLTVKWGGIKK